MTDNVFLIYTDNGENIGVAYTRELAVETMVEYMRETFGYKGTDIESDIEENLCVNGYIYAEELPFFWE